MVALWIIGMLLSFMLTAYAFKKIELAKMLIVGADIYFSLYVIAAGVLINKDTFSINSALVIVLVIEIIILIAMTMVKGIYIPRIILAPKKYIAIIVILIIAAAISLNNTSEGYGTGQDEGLYQIRAWYYMTNENGNVLDFSEYYNIESDTEKTEYIQYINQMVGYYRIVDDDINDERTSQAKGVTHGILTFPALLGLWGVVFGIKNMNGVLTLMYLLTIANVWLTCGNLKLKQYVGAIASCVMAISPIMIWSSRNVLSEIVIAMFISTFILLISEDKKRDKGIMSAIPIIAVCYFHVTVTIFIPLIVIVYLLLIFSTRKASYAVGLILSMIGYMTGFFMMWSSSHAYTKSSFEQIFKMTNETINSDNIGGFIIGAASIVIVFSVLMLLRPLRMATTSGFARMQKSAKARKVFGIVICVITSIIIAFSIYKCVKVHFQNMRVLNTGLLCYVLNTAFVFVPAAFAGIFLTFKRLAKNKNYLVIYIAFLYIVFMYCDFMWVLIYRYFYYARYFTPFVSIVVLAGAILINKINFKIAIPVALVCGGILIWQSWILYTNRDMTAFDYEVVESIVSSVGEDDAVIVLDQGYGIYSVFALPVRATTSADIYFAQDYDLLEKIGYYSGYYNDVYVLLYDVGRYTDEEGKWRYVYRTKLDASYYDDYVDEGLPFPKEVVEIESPFALIVYEGDEE